jgi:diguanylate cyclase (GGDEF)-like protein
MSRLMLLIILAVGLSLGVFVIKNAERNLTAELTAYQTESSAATATTADRIESTFDEMYRALRTVALLQSVRSIDWDSQDATGFNHNSKHAAQELFNTLISDYDFNDIYIVPVNRDPHGDYLATTNSSGAGSTPIAGRLRSKEDAKGIEIDRAQEYRLIRSQLDWFLANSPDGDATAGIDCPALWGSPIETPGHPRTGSIAPGGNDRARFVLSVPIYDQEGALRGCVSGVVLTGVLSSLLRTGDEAIFNTAYDRAIPPLRTGQWAISRATGAGMAADDRLLYSETRTLQTASHGGSWVLWAGHAKEAFWSRSGVRYILYSRSLGLALSFLVTLGSLAGIALVYRSSKHAVAFNSKLVEAVADRTATLSEAHAVATNALGNKISANTELELALFKLERDASIDKLTKLPNRDVFFDRLDQKIKNSWRDGSRFAVLFFDFDRFKVVNDSLGHDVGDALLCDIADIFRRELRRTDTVARFGGDEFVVLLGDLSSQDDAIKKTESLLNCFATPHQLEDHLVVSTASIGLVTSNSRYDNPADMIRDADAAMYQAKANGKGQFVLFDCEMHDDALDRFTLEADLRLAIEREQFRLVYQPIIELESGALTGFEALLRWDHPKRGLVSPIEFIPIAEDTGLINQIGDWVLNTACAQISNWNRRFGSEQFLTMSINVSKRQLLGPKFISTVRSAKNTFNLRSQELKIEVTESTVTEVRSGVAQILCDIRRLGIPIVMDDFGTGVSSLSALHEYPIDILKIDQSFIRVLDQDRSLLAIVDAIAQLAANLNIQTVAEGVETRDIVGALQSINCTWAQGYFFSKPLNTEDAEQYITKQYSPINTAA